MRMTRRTWLSMAAVPLVAQSASLDYIVWDVATARTVEERGELTASFAPGSLLKPFLALAAFRSLPGFRCDGRGCWLPSGHGDLHLDTALAVSCNAYFRALSSTCSNEQVQRVWRMSGLIDTSATMSADSRWGYDPTVKVNGVALCSAYAWLARQRGLRAAAVQQGLRLAASRGTARALHDKLPQWAILAKTGTTRCAHRLQTNEDGLCIALAPAAHPRYVVWCRVHGQSGSHAAKDTAGVLAARLATGG